VAVESSDPTVIRSIAVTAQDLVSALEMNQTSQKRAVLRVTPPFSGRMRARIHIEQKSETPTQVPAPIHILPGRLVAQSLPAYPRPAETEDKLRSDPNVSYTVERHHDRHKKAVQQWREQALTAIREHTTLETAAGSHEVEITVLGEFL